MLEKPDNKGCKMYTGNQSRIVVAKAALNKKKNISTSNLDVKFREETTEVVHL
jgi:hypothetical protein